MSSFSDRIKSLRERKGWTKTYVASHLGIKMQTYANYEYGIREPDLKLVNNIAKLFEVSTDYLLNGNKVTPKKAKEVDLADKDALLMYQGKPVSDEDKEMILRLMRGKEED